MKGEKKDDKCIIWSLGCILYELVFRTPPFNIDKIEDKDKNIIYNLNQYKEVMDKISDLFDKDLCFILKKLLCVKEERLNMKQLICEGIFKKKIIEINLFSDIVKENLQSK